jgi:hypothetical protein
MKKKISTLLLLAFATTLWSQSSIVKINTDKSNIHWLAKKVTGQHDGYISLTNGSLEMDGAQLTGGSFEVHDFNQCGRPHWRIQSQIGRAFEI